MNKRMKCIIKSSILSLALLVMMIPSIPVHAEDIKYTITFSAGSAEFKPEYCDNLKTKKIEVNKGAYHPYYPSYNEINVPMDKYILEDTTYPTGDFVERNKKFVVQYGTLNNGVEYKVEFVDASTGAEIATPVIGRGEAGSDSPFIAALDITDYELADPSITSIQFNRMQSTDTLTYQFKYNYTGTGGGTTVITEPGTTTLITTDGGTETIYQVNEVPTYVSTPVAGGGGAGAGGGAAEGGAQPAEGGDAGAQIDDGDVPLADGVLEDEKKGLENDGKDVILEDEEVPKGLFGTGVNPTSAIIASGIGLAVIAAVLFGISRFKKSRIAAVSDQGENTTE